MRSSRREQVGSTTGSLFSYLEESCISQHFPRVMGVLVATLVREESVLLAGQYLSMSITYLVCLGSQA